MWDDVKIGTITSILTMHSVHSWIGSASWFASARGAGKPSSDPNRSLWGAARHWDSPDPRPPHEIQPKVYGADTRVALAYNHLPLKSVSAIRYPSISRWYVFEGEICIGRRSRVSARVRSRYTSTVDSVAITPEHSSQSDHILRSLWTDHSWA